MTGATALHAAEALLPSGWRADVRIAVQNGRIAAVSPDSPALPGDERHGVVLPAIPNLHSHAFQRGMAGLAERRGPGSDSFWSWRETMYRFALAMTPEHVEAVAAQLWSEIVCVPILPEVLLHRPRQVLRLRALAGSPNLAQSATIFSSRA